MSRATPEKTKGRLVGLARGRQGLASGEPLHHTGPWSRRSRWSRGRRRASQAAWRPVSSFEKLDSARASSVGRDHRGRWSRRILVRRGDADREMQTSIMPLTLGALTRKVDALQRQRPVEAGFDCTPAQKQPPPIEEQRPGLPQSRPVRSDTRRLMFGKGPARGLEHEAELADLENVYRRPLRGIRRPVLCLPQLGGQANAANPGILRYPWRSDTFASGITGNGGGSIET